MVRSFQFDDILDHGRKYGYHGYDNLAPSMQAVFLANGPRFNQKIKVSFLEIVDLYHLFAKLLGIEDLVPALKIDGADRKDVWAKMLKVKEEPTKKASTKSKKHH